MIVVRLSGGLGNQMFQYATGKRLAARYKVDLQLDVSSYDADPLRIFALNNYAIRAVPATDDVQAVCQRLRKRSSRILNLFGVRRGLRRYREQTFSFDSRVLNLPDNVYLDGFWQSEKYFFNIAEELRVEFRPRILTDAVTRMSQTMEGTASVSLHVRRGDYAYNPETLKYHGLCTIKYYERALNDLVDRVGSGIHVFVFTDDAAWVAHNLNVPYETTYVSEGDKFYDYEELYLMSRCRHNIIANSTFSWWGAWLNSNSDKLVYAPARWFAAADINSTSDLIPGGWVRIEG